jgi:hypothetical protein
MNKLYLSIYHKHDKLDKFGFFRDEGPITLKGQTLISIKPIDIHREVWDIYGDDEMCHRSICRWVAKFKTGQQKFKDAILAQVVLQQELKQHRNKRAIMALD